MPIPDFQSLMLPVLRDLEAGERNGQEMLDSLSSQFALTPEELNQRLPSGKQTTFTNRIAWAKSHLKGAGLLETPKRGVYRLTERGRKVLAENPAAVNMAFLAKFPEYVAFRSSPEESQAASVATPSAAGAIVLESRTPDDLIDDGYSQLRKALIADLRERIGSMPPSGFEQLVVDLLTGMGYGGPQDDAGLVVGKGGDEGIDGIIKEDRLGLETIYVQAKRWQSSVGRPEIQRFAGALQGQRARKGVFITSSSFTKEALSYAGTIQTTIVLIDGAQLAELMIDHDVGVSTVKRFDIKKVDSDYFTVE